MARSLIAPCRAALMCLAALAVACPTLADDKQEKPADAKVGDKAPAFTTRTDEDGTWDTSEHFGRKWVVVYFYPGDFPPRCTAQANAFRDAMNKLTDKGVEVVGVSGDSVKNHQIFKEVHKLNFTLLADEDGALAKKFGVPLGKGAKVKAKDAEGKPVEITRGVTAARWTFIIGKDGKVAYKNTKVVPAQDAKAITEFITKAEGK